MKNSIVLTTLLFACFTAKGQFYQQSPKLVATGLTGIPAFGSSVALSSDGTTAIVGAPGSNGDPGTAIIFNRSGSNWAQGVNLVGSGAIGGANQGFSVSISSDGNTAIIGGPSDNSNSGAAWIFTRNGGLWTEQAKLSGSNATGSALQGSSVALSGDGNTAIVGGPSNNGGLGAAWVYSRSGNVWTQQHLLIGAGAVTSSAYPSSQGFSVALSFDGNTAIIGAPVDGGTHGAVWIFTRAGNAWSQQGPKLTGNSLSYLGTSVAIAADGNTAIIGAAGVDNKYGGAYIIVRSGNIWTVQGPILQGSFAVGNTQQGGSVSISGDGNTVVIGGGTSIFSTVAGNIGIGACWIYTRTGIAWTQAGNKYVGVGNAGNSQQGAAVSMSADGNTFITGGFADNNKAGAIWVFSKTIPPTTSVSDAAIAAINIYPNPTQRVINIKSSLGLSNELADADGKILITRNQSSSLDISALPSGVYFLNLYDENRNKIKSQKIIKFN